MRGLPSILSLFLNSFNKFNLNMSTHVRSSIYRKINHIKETALVLRRAIMFGNPIHDSQRTTKLEYLCVNSTKRGISRVATANWGLATANQPTSQPTNQPTNQPASQPASQPTNQPTNQPTEDSSVWFDTVKLVIVLIKGSQFQLQLHVFEYHFVQANSVDTDEMPHYAIFHLGLHCLQKYTF